PTTAHIGYISIADAWLLKGDDGTSPANPDGTGDAPTWWCRYNGYSIGVTNTAAANSYKMDRSAVAEGKYTFWGAEHFYGDSTGERETVFRPEFVNAMDAFLLTSPSAMANSEMKVSRTTDGGPVSANYF